MSVQTARLGDIADDLRSGFACGVDDPDGVIQFRMNNVERDGTLNWTKTRRVPQSMVKDGLTLQSDDILLNATNSPDLVGKTALFVGAVEPITFSNHFLRLRTKTNAADPAYVARWLRRQFELGNFKAMCRSWVNQASITRDQVSNLEIPLPPLDEQKRIAAILDKADQLRQKRRQAIALLDSLTQSIFLEMFGDPVSNPKGWPQSKVGDICRVVTGNTPSRETAAYYDGADVEWIKSDNIVAGNTFLSKAAECLSSKGKAVARVAPPNSTLVTCIAGSPNSIGNVGLADREVAFNQQINAVIPVRLEPWFQFFHLKYAKKLVQAQSTGGMKGLVSKSRLESVLLMDPPMELQQDFTKSARLHSSVAERLITDKNIDALFSSLQHRAFSGQL
ncbi:restriction endonuclease subunit S [Sinorhizobium meliloti]|uniref:restriction endonuclease subunit S n=1 Tax=Rhizobium meliloti TaxID=382 RepID=UPI00237F7193|nr:restriction endonuclease subunit S [Sinorhizobium meliloti]MDE3808857.1 restriction endonuclease subunit S [Sinorhizobium meliloti]